MISCQQHNKNRQLIIRGSDIFCHTEKICFRVRNKGGKDGKDASQAAASEVEMKIFDESNAAVWSKTVASVSKAKDNNNKRKGGTQDNQEKGRNKRRKGWMRVCTETEVIYGVSLNNIFVF
jgi:hypothetical protein